MSLKPGVDDRGLLGWRRPRGASGFVQGFQLAGALATSALAVGGARRWPREAVAVAPARQARMPKIGIIGPMSNLLLSPSSSAASQKETGKSRPTIPELKFGTSGVLRARLTLTNGLQAAVASTG